MTSRELKKYLKKLAIGIGFALIIVIILLIYTLGGKKAELSVYANADYVENNLQTLGIDENEMKEYLAVFGNLVNQNYNENQQQLNMATNFVENMCSFYEVKTDSNSFKTYDADMIDTILEEIQGLDMKEKLQKDEIYEYNENEKIYIQKQEIDKLTYCTEINKTMKREDEVEIIYTLAIMTKEQMAEYKMGANVELETHQIKAVLVNQSEHEYSKYFVKTIEEVEKM